ncbi:MAG: hypothetical protein ACREU9_12670 [Gammaproteobacteria bacterium]
MTRRRQIVGETPRHDIQGEHAPGAARRLIERCGYGRRKVELANAEAAAAARLSAAQGPEDMDRVLGREPLPEIAGVGPAAILERPLSESGGVAPRSARESSL